MLGTDNNLRNKVILDMTKYTYFSYLIICQVNYEHFPFIVDFVYFRPSEMMGFTRSLECEYAQVVNSKVQLITSMVLINPANHKGSKIIVIIMIRIKAQQENLPLLDGDPHHRCQGSKPDAENLSPLLVVIVQQDESDAAPLFSPQFVKSALTITLDPGHSFPHVPLGCNHQDQLQ